MSGRPASSYEELHKRLHHLQKATKHLERLITERSNKSSFVSHVGSSFLGEEKNQILNQEISTSKLKQHLSTVNLQIGVTNFMQNVKSLQPENKRNIVPTLFGNGKERAELVVMVYLMLNVTLYFKLFNDTNYFKCQTFK